MTGKKQISGCVVRTFFFHLYIPPSQLAIALSLLLHTPRCASSTVALLALLSGLLSATAGDSVPSSIT